jgi:hypothetical protein
LGATMPYVEVRTVAVSDQSGAQDDPRKLINEGRDNAHQESG